MIFKGALNYYGIKPAPITPDGNSSESHDISEKPVHNQAAEPQEKVKEEVSRHLRLIGLTFIIRFSYDTKAEKLC